MSLYFDNAATTKPKSSVVEAIMPYLQTMWYNPSAKYSDAVKVREKIDECREQVAAFIGAKPHEIYFTSGAAESNNWAIRGFDDYNKSKYRSTVLISSFIEHKSIMNLIKADTLYNQKRMCMVNKYGMLDLDVLEDLLIAKKKDYSALARILVSVCLANNEIGTVQDIKDIAELAHMYGAVLHTDATQALGKVKINVKEMNIDMLSASAQKVGGLKGTGILYIREGLNISPLIYGSQENGMRGGTENVIGIIAMAEALKTCNIDENQIRATRRRNQLLDMLDKNNVEYRLNGAPNGLPNIINITFENMTGEALMFLLETSGIMISAGSACNTYTLEPSYVLRSIGLSDEEVSKTIRISLPDDCTEKDIDKLGMEIIRADKIFTTTINRKK